MISTDCRKCAKSDICYADDVKPCIGYEPKKQTNADRIRAMTDEEMAVVIAWPYLASPPWCAEHRTCPHISEDQTPCDNCALDWLKQEVTE